jgi:hypothetical protein
MHPQSTLKRSRERQIAAAEDSRQAPRPAQQASADQQKRPKLLRRLAAVEEWAGSAVREPLDRRRASQRGAGYSELHC